MMRQPPNRKPPTNNNLHQPHINPHEVFDLSPLMYLTFYRNVKLCNIFVHFYYYVIHTDVSGRK